MVVLDSSVHEKALMIALPPPPPPPERWLKEILVADGRGVDSRASVADIRGANIDIHLNFE